MLTACISPNHRTLKTGANGKRELLQCRIEYFDPSDAITPVGSGNLTVPVQTNLRALERMLALWSMGTNKEEVNVTA